MTRRLRKVALTAHLTFSVGWLGADAAFLALAIVGMTSQSVQIVRVMTEVLSSTQFPEGGRPLCIDRHANIDFVNSNAALKHVPEINRRTPEGKVTVIAGGEEPQQDVGVAALFRHINSA